jgi:signal transduction histidine kinase
LLLVVSIVLPALTFGWLGYRIWDLQRAYFQLKTRAAASGLPVDGLEHGDTLFVYYTVGALAVMMVALFTRYLLWRDLRRYKRLAATVSHELRTPLTTIQMYAETLAWQRVTDPARQRTYLETIARESRRLEHVVGNILRYVRSDWEPRMAIGQRIAAQEIVSSVVERLTPWFEHSGHRIRLRANSGAQVVADRGALEQAVENLLANAMKYSPEGSEVEISVEQRNGHVLVRVADAGEGVPARDRQAIFQEFFRAPNATADGIGLGLPLVKRIAEAHRGKVWVEDNSPKGAVFTIQLPVAERMQA